MCNYFLWFDAIQRISYASVLLYCSKNVAYLFCTVLEIVKRNHSYRPNIKKYSNLILYNTFEDVTFITTMVLGDIYVSHGDVNKEDCPMGC
jgi:hypothetical protein